MRLSQKRTSHPVGTTVRVEDFLRRLPVRRQAAEKTAVRMLAKVKKMLQSYALTRPQLRLSLKILKAKDRKGDWMYPKGGALSASRVEANFNAATDIFGKKLTSECESTVSTWSSAGEQIDESMIEHSGSSASSDEAYTLEAINAKKDCGMYFPNSYEAQRFILIYGIFRWLSIVQCRPIFIGRFETGFVRKRNLEADHIIVQVSSAFYNR